MAQNFTTDTTQWAIVDEGVYVENPEFSFVKTDNEGKILYGVKTDGEFFFGVGCPQQVKDYIEDKLKGFSLDEYEDIVAFLSDYLGSDTTLRVMIDEINAQITNKLDAEGLDPDALGTVQAVENPEYIQVTTDSEGKILEGRKHDGTVVENVGIEAKEVSANNINADEATIETANINSLSLSEEGINSLVDDLKEHGISGEGITQEELDQQLSEYYKTSVSDNRYAVKSIEGTVSQNSQDIAAIEASIDVNPPAVVALRDELDGVEARVDAIEQAGGLTPPTINLYKKIASELIITQAELNSWEGHVVEVIADLKLTGNTNFTLPTNTIIFMNGGQFVSDSYAGSLNFNNAYIVASPYQIIGSSISITGLIRAKECLPNWFGALGDGVHDDTSSIQKAISHCIRTYIKNGTYYISSTISIQSNRVVTLEDNAELISVSNLNSSIFKNSDQVNGNENISIIGGKIDGNKDNQTSYNAVIHLEKVSSFTLKNIHVKNVYSWIPTDWGGVRIIGCSYGNLNRLIVHDCNHEGVFCDESNNLKITDCCFYNNGNSGIDIGNSVECIISGVHSYNNQATGISINGHRNVCVGCISHNNFWGITIGHEADAPHWYADYACVVGNTVFNNSRLGINSPNAATNVVLQANSVFGNKVKDYSCRATYKNHIFGNTAFGEFNPTAILQLVQEKSNTTIPDSTALFVGAGQYIRFTNGDHNADYGAYMYSDAHGALIFGFRSGTTDTDLYKLDSSGLNPINS